MREFQSMAVFPLPGCVFLPDTLLPLHIFEPRYREMTEYVLGGSGQMIMVNQTGSAGRGVHGKIGCLGRVVGSKRQQDGRYYIVLRGVCRVQIAAEEPLVPYSFVRASAVESLDHPCAQEELTKHLALTRKICHRLAQFNEKFDEKLSEIDFEQKPNWVTNILMNELCHDPEIRQAFLEERDVYQRLTLLNAELSQILIQNEPKGTIH